MLYKLKVVIFLRLLKGPNSIFGPKHVFSSSWGVKTGCQINQILAIEVFYKYLRIYNIGAFSLIFEFLRVIVVFWLKEKPEERRE